MPAARLATVGFCAGMLFAGRDARADDGVATVFPPIASDALLAGPSLRTSGDEIVLFPTGSLQVDGAFFPRQTPKSGVFLRRARVGVSGWLGSSFYFDLSGDFAPAPTPPAGADIPPSALPAADAYLAFAPDGDHLIVQAGQFDAPFTLENRTSDAATDFTERSMAVRTLGVPRNKEVGAMIHGLVAGDRLYYSAGLFNGEGPGFRNLDNQAHAIGRVVVSPFAAGENLWRRFSFGASAWAGDHVNGPTFPVQATPGGVVFFEPHWVSGQVAPLQLELREQGTVEAFGGELSLPVGPRFGLRGEVVWKRQQLAEADASPLPGAPLAPRGNAILHGIAGYGEAWFWLLGDDRLLPAPGRELPRRLARTDPSIERPGDPLFADGLMLAVRGEVLKEDLDSDNQLLSDPGTATTRVYSGTAAVTYWRGRFVRLSANYVLNRWSGTSQTVEALAAGGRFEQEFLLRFAASL